MRLLLRATVVAVVLLFITVIVIWLALPHMTDRKVSGELTLPILDEPVSVVRDANGMPYIYAESLDDATRAQGFVIGQDRLFQLEVAKRAATGRLAEVLGAGPDDVILDLDKEARVVGFERIARQQLQILTPVSRRQLSLYLEGLNTYITTRESTHPLEFSLAGFSPEPWSEAELLAIAFYLGWGSSGNMNAELVAFEVIREIGAAAFAKIAPLAINPDDVNESQVKGIAPVAAHELSINIASPAAWTRSGWRQLGVGGSNNWAISGEKAGMSAAVVTNDPHLDSRSLPGPWHPVGIITPELRVVGVTAGLPGVVIGRNDHVAFGVTNAYADTVDLYIERLDPDRSDHYLEGEVSIPFDIVTERIRVSDPASENGYRDVTLDIRFTRRGPVITDHREELDDDAVLSLRWASAEYLGNTLGLDTLMLASNVDEALESVSNTNIVSLNFVVGDTSGRVARHASGVAPKRLSGDGMVPFLVTDGVDNWGGRIPAVNMPGEVDPKHGWTGSANHMTAPADYPWVYTTYASPTYRYQRIKELLSAPRVTAEEVWTAQYDTLNLFARDIAPILAEALNTADEASLKRVGAILSEWDYRDDAQLLAPTLFQEVIRQLARATFVDEMGEEISAAYLSNWYVWQQRFDAMLKEGNSRWFDDQRTNAVEDLTTLIRRATASALTRLTAEYGEDRTNWQWGEVHRIEFVGPLRLKGWLGELTGNRSVAMSGSGETLLRALYPQDQPFNSKWFASLRMTADLNDSHKVRAVLPGGSVGRTFNPHLADQTSDWMDQKARQYWWFSDEAIQANTVSHLLLSPGQ